MTGAPPFLRPLPDGRFISAASFGCSSMWAKPAFDRAEALRLLEVGVEAGLNYLDTGPSYASGEGEARLGAFLTQHGASNLIVSTKVGSNFDAQRALTRSFAVADMERSLTDSLRRLGLQRVDILYLHGPSLNDLNDDVLRFLENEKQRGRIVWSGVNSFDMDVVTACVDLPVDAVMIQYNIADLRAEPLLRAFHERRKIVVSATAMARAVYSPSTFVPRNRASLWYLLRALKSDPLFLVKGHRLSRRIQQAGFTSGSDAAMRFVAGNPLIHSAAFGTTQAAHMKANIESARHPMSEAQRQVFLAP